MDRRIEFWNWLGVDVACYPAGAGQAVAMGSVMFGRLEVGDGA